MDRPYPPRPPPSSTTVLARIERRHIDVFDSDRGSQPELVPRRFSRGAPNRYTPAFIGVTQSETLRWRCRQGRLFTAWRRFDRQPHRTLVLRSPWYALSRGRLHRAQNDSHEPQHTIAGPVLLPIRSHPRPDLALRAQGIVGAAIESRPHGRILAPDSGIRRNRPRLSGPLRRPPTWANACSRDRSRRRQEAHSQADDRRAEQGGRGTDAGVLGRAPEIRRR